MPPLARRRALAPRTWIVAAIASWLFLPAKTSATPSPERIWSQERVAWNPDGSPIEPLRMRADELEGLTVQDFALTPDITLRVETNIARPLERGLDDLATAVAAAWIYTRNQLDIAARGDVLLYLIEVDETPLAYRFEACDKRSSRYGEVRLAWIPRGAPLSGQGMPADLAELVFDTLPHEFVHDQLDQLPMLRQELSTGPNPGTRWFVEGLCELLAKDFSLTAAPSTWARTVRMRRLEHAAALVDTSGVLLDWSQEGAAPQLESDLYGASMLVLRVWTNERDLRGLVQQLRTAAQPVGGHQLMRWMHEDLERTDASLIILARRAAAGLLAGLPTEAGSTSR